MTASVEISYYPFDKDYVNIIMDFVKKLESQENLDVVVNSFSTQIYGDYDVLMDMLKNELREVLTDQRSIAVIKIAGRDLRGGIV